MPVIPLPSHATRELPKSPDDNPYVVHNPCQGKGQFEVNEVLFEVAHDKNVPFSLAKKSPIKNTGNVELTVKTPGD